jgi:hypothetical protein
MEYLRFTLEFLVKCESARLAEFEQSARQELVGELPHINFNVTPAGTSIARLFICGSREVVDAAHEQLEKKVFDRYETIRVIDELSEQLRIEAFPILARFEPRLRAFIIQAMTETLGFSWWEKLGDDSIKSRVSDVEKRNRGSVFHHHPIEFSEFEHLGHDFREAFRGSNRMVKCKDRANQYHHPHPA